MIQLADSEEQDLLVAGAHYASWDTLESVDSGSSFWQSPVVLFLCVALTLLAFASR